MMRSQVVQLSEPYIGQHPTFLPLLCKHLKQSKQLLLRAGTGLGKTTFFITQEKALREALGVDHIIILEPTKAIVISFEGLPQYLDGQIPAKDPLISHNYQYESCFIATFDNITKIPEHYLQKSLVVIDEVHDIIRASYRFATLVPNFEKIMEHSKYVVAMSGTIKPELFSKAGMFFLDIKPAYHIKFKANFYRQKATPKEYAKRQVAPLMVFIENKRSLSKMGTPTYYSYESKNVHKCTSSGVEAVRTGNLVGCLGVTSAAQSGLSINSLGGKPFKRGYTIIEANHHNTRSASAIKQASNRLRPTETMEVDIYHPQIAKKGLEAGELVDIKGIENQLYYAKIEMASLPIEKRKLYPIEMRYLDSGLGELFFLHSHYETASYFNPVQVVADLKEYGFEEISYIDKSMGAGSTPDRDYKDAKAAWHEMILWGCKDIEQTMTEDEVRRFIIDCSDCIVKPTYTLLETFIREKAIPESLGMSKYLSRAISEVFEYRRLYGEIDMKQVGSLTKETYSLTQILDTTMRVVKALQRDWRTILNVIKRLEKADVIGDHKEESVNRRKILTKELHSTKKDIRDGKRGYKILVGKEQWKRGSKKTGLVASFEDWISIKTVTETNGSRKVEVLRSCERLPTFLIKWKAVEHLFDGESKYRRNDIKKFFFEGG